MHRNLYLSGAFASLTALLTACAGNTNGSANSSLPAQDPQAVASDEAVRLTGRFIDSAVINISYVTHDGTNTSSVQTTNASGEFNYLEGDVISFFIGADGEGLLLGSTHAKTVITPIDLVEGAVNEDNQTVTNMIRFLQALDEDGNTSNGISLSDSTTAAANSPQSLDFEVTSSSFENTGHAMLRFLLSDNDAMLVGTDEARAHLRQSIASEQQ